MEEVNRFRVGRGQFLAVCLQHHPKAPDRELKAMLLIKLPTWWIRHQCHVWSPTEVPRMMPDTREELLEGKKRPCCWAGCIHRTDKAPGRWQQAVLIDGKKRDA